MARRVEPPNHLCMRKSVHVTLAFDFMFRPVKSTTSFTVAAGWLRMAFSATYFGAPAGPLFSAASPILQERVTQHKSSHTSKNFTAGREEKFNAKKESETKCRCQALGWIRELRGGIWGLISGDGDMGNEAQVAVCHDAGT